MTTKLIERMETAIRNTENRGLTTSALRDGIAEIERLEGENERLKAGWQEIASAPKDGTPILAWCVHPHARHATDDKDWSAAVVTQWIDHNGGGWTWNGMAGTFTHWQPLPAPPSDPQS